MKKELGKKTYYFPMPVVVIGTYDKEGHSNAMTAAWTGIHDTNMAYVCLSSDHKTVKNLKETGACTLMFATTSTIKEADYLGIESGNKVANKIEKCGLTSTKSKNVYAPIINEFPVCLECSIHSLEDDGQTAYLILDIRNVLAEENILDKDGNIDVTKLHPISYDPAKHTYYEISNIVGLAYTDGKVFK